MIGVGALRYAVASVIVLMVVGCGMRSAPVGRATATPACSGNARRPPDGSTPILAIHHTPSLTAERYEAVVRGLTGGRDRLDSLSDGGIHGLLVHVAGQGADGFWVVDVWESRAAIDDFGRRVRPIARAAGIEEPMGTYAVRTFLTC